MSELHVHGVTEASQREAVEAAGAKAIVHRDLAAIASDAEEGERAAELMRRHWRLLEAVGESSTVLPVRFGTAMASEQAVVEEFLEPKHDDLATQLATFSGKVQLTVKGNYDEQALLRTIVERSPQVAALRERVAALPREAAHFEQIRLGELVAAEVEQERERDAAWLLDQLTGLAVASSHEPAGGLDGAVNASFLVERERVDEFTAAAGEAASRLADRVQLRTIGPLPPFSFAGEQVAWA